MSKQPLRDHNGDIVECWLCIDCSYAAEGYESESVVPVAYVNYSSCGNCPYDLSEDECIESCGTDNFSSARCDNLEGVCPNGHLAGTRYRYSYFV